ncbi:MAG: hypothetical protein V4526_00065 [Patescibacteria group bacterium]
MNEPLDFLSYIYVPTIEPGNIAFTLFNILLTISPIIVCLALAGLFFPIWVRFVRAKFFFKEKYAVIEMKLPKETVKSPAAMELFLMSLHQTSGESTWYDKYWLGKTRTWFSLELVSIEGQVRFFIWTRASWKTFITASLYSQFPGIEIHDVDDYTRSVHWEPKEIAVWGGEFTLTKPDPYPIKTYVDYGLDKDPKEEFKVDPMAPMIEALGTVGQNQQIWIHILVRAHKAEQTKPGFFFKTTDKWKDDAMAEVNKIMIRDPKTKLVGTFDDNKHIKPELSPGEQDIIKALERSITKQGFDVGIRFIYVAKKENFTPGQIPTILGSFKQFSSEHLNGFKPNGKKWVLKFDYPWQDFKEIRQNRQRDQLLQAMKRRSYFFPPFESKPFVLNSEELATIYHFPGQVAPTPTLSRIGSKKVDAPPNLPI